MTVISLPLPDNCTWRVSRKCCSNQWPFHNTGHLLPQPKQLWGSNTASWVWKSYVTLSEISEFHRDVI